MILYYIFLFMHIFDEILLEVKQKINPSEIGYIENKIIYFGNYIKTIILTNKIIIECIKKYNELESGNIKKMFYEMIFDLILIYYNFKVDNEGYLHESEYRNLILIDDLKIAYRIFNEKSIPCNESIMQYCTNNTTSIDLVQFKTMGTNWKRNENIMKLYTVKVDIDDSYESLYDYYLFNAHRNYNRYDFTINYTHEGHFDDLEFETPTFEYGDNVHLF